MNLHANAALSLNKRRVLARRVVVQGWTLAGAARAAEVSVRTAQRWSSRFRVEARRG
jgi:transposase